MSDRLHPVGRKTDIMKAAREFYEFDAGRRLTQDGSHPVVRARNELVLSLLTPGARCLDVGCGSGGFAPLLATRFRQVSGVDLSHQLARQARSRGMLAVAADVDEGDLPFTEGSFDAVVCCDVLEHVFDPVNFVERLRRVLRPEGSLVVSVPNIRYWPRVRSLLGGYFPRTTGDPNGYDGGHLHYFATRNLEEILRQASLREVRTVGFNADPSRRAHFVTQLLRWPATSGFAREFGCSTIVAAARR
jgi:methionine biosynthesis protein MetW